MTKHIQTAILAAIAIGIWAIVLQNAGVIKNGVAVSGVHDGIAVRGSKIPQMGFSEDEGVPVVVRMAEDPFDLREPLRVKIEK